MALDWIDFNHKDLLIVRYEDLKSDFIGETLKVLKYLNLPFDEKRIKCLRKYPMNKYKRKSKLNHAVFCEEAAKEIDHALTIVNY